MGVTSKNLRFLVTGAARGVGLAVCESAKKDGAFVVGVDINDIQSDAVDHKLMGDLGDPKFCERIISEAGQIDVLVNAAGLLRPQKFQDVTSRRAARNGEEFSWENYQLLICCCSYWWDHLSTLRGGESRCARIIQKYCQRVCQKWCDGKFNCPGRN